MCVSVKPSVNTEGINEQLMKREKKEQNGSRKINHDTITGVSEYKEAIYAGECFSVPTPQQ